MLWETQQTKYNSLYDLRSWAVLKLASDDGPADAVYADDNRPG